MTNNKGTKFLIGLLVVVIIILTAFLLRDKFSEKEVAPEGDVPKTEVAEKKVFTNEKYGFSLSFKNSLSAKRLSDRQFSIINGGEEVVLEGVVLDNVGESELQSYEEFVLDSSRLLCAEQLESESKCLLIEDISPLTSGAGVTGEVFYIRGVEQNSGDLRGPVFAFNVSDENSGTVSALLIFSPFNQTFSQGRDDLVREIVDTIEID